MYNLAWSGHESKWLFAGTAAGLVGWNIEEEKVTPKYRPMMVDFLLPENERDKVRLYCSFKFKKKISISTNIETLLNSNIGQE